MLCGHWEVVESKFCIWTNWSLRQLVQINLREQFVDEMLAFLCGSSRRVTQTLRQFCWICQLTLWFARLWLVSSQGWNYFCLQISISKLHNMIEKNHYPFYSTWCQTYTLHATQLPQLVMVWQSTRCTDGRRIAIYALHHRPSSTLANRASLVQPHREIFNGRRRRPILLIRLSGNWCFRANNREAIRKMATKLFAGSKLRKSLWKFQNLKAFMHLDTVFTMIDRDKFTIHPEIATTAAGWIVSFGEGWGSAIPTNYTTNRFEHVLRVALGLLTVTLIEWRWRSDCCCSWAVDDCQILWRLRR